MSIYIVDMLKGNCLFGWNLPRPRKKREAELKIASMANWKIFMAVFVCYSITEIDCLGIILVANLILCM